VICRCLMEAICICALVNCHAFEKDVARCGPKCFSEFVRLRGYGTMGESIESIAIGALRKFSVFCDELRVDCSDCLRDKVGVCEGVTDSFGCIT
jgi:hypothetical protein